MTRVKCKACGHHQDNGPELGSRDCDRCGGSAMLFARRSSDRASIMLELAKLDAAVRVLATEHGVPLARLLERVQATYDSLVPALGHQQRDHRGHE